jgi:ADP-heptose:LPS heptosyltransferase
MLVRLGKTATLDVAVNAPGRALRSKRAMFDFLVSRADAARDDKRYQTAAALYEEAVQLDPGRADIQIQCGHMFKESGALETAEGHYLAALRLTPDDSDLSLQLGHFYKVSGRLHEAQKAYEAALRLQPGWDLPERELEGLRSAGWRGVPSPPVDGFDPGAGDGDRAPSGLDGAVVSRLAPGLARRRPDDLLHSHGNQIDVRQLGRREVGYWGLRRTLRGVEAVRGFCISETPILEVQVLLNGLTIYRGPTTGGFTLSFEIEKERFKKYVFNVWLDFSPFARGRQVLKLRFFGHSGECQSFRDDVIIEEPISAAAYPYSNALVTIDPHDRRSLEEQVRSHPSMVAPARRALFPDGVRNVLVMRTDQLGDLVASVPALKRLRSIVPEANIVGLLTEANAGLARTLGLFDEVIVVDFPDDQLERRRVMSLESQETLRRTLEPYGFDIAVDLAQANVSRDLLQLAGAKILCGAGGGDWPWLSAEINFSTRDRWNNLDITPHSRRILAMIEGLGAMLNNDAHIIRRDDLSRAILEPYGIDATDRFVVLHTGARIAFSRWPHAATLASMLIERTGVKVVMMSDDPSARSALPETLLSNERFLYLDRRLTFDEFDAFLSFATVVVGNDSGPKHLAALRGANVVTLFTARHNWQEWGQESVGTIISRRVPCAGCTIMHDDEECGKGFTCIVDIRPEEVFAAMMAYIEQPERTSA